MSKARIKPQIGCTIKTGILEDCGMIYTQPLSYIEKIKNMINKCIILDIPIPLEWVEEYNKSIKK